MPSATCIKVVLPAPFSPSNPCSSPAAKEKSAPRSARTEPNRLWIPTSSRTGGTDSKARWMIVEVPVQVEILRHVRGHCLNPERLSGIVPGVNDVQAPFHGIKIGVVGTFSGDEGIEAGLARRSDHVSCTPSNDPDPLRSFRPSRDQGRTSFQAVQYAIQFQRQQLPGQ